MDKQTKPTKEQIRRLVLEFQAWLLRKHGGDVEQARKEYELIKKYFREGGE